MLKTKHVVSKAGKDYYYVHNKRTTKEEYQRNITAFTKTGKLNKKVQKMFEKEAKAQMSEEFGEVDNSLDLEQFEQAITSDSRRAYGRRNDKSLYGLLLSFNESKVEGMFLNAGLSLEAAASQIGVDPEELLNEDRWSNKHKIYTAPDGTVYEFDFRYNDTVFRKAKK